MTLCAFFCFGVPIVYICVMFLNGFRNTYFIFIKMSTHF